VIVAIDFDGTLADITHRLHFIQGEHKDWPAFYRACVDDMPIMPLVLVAHALVLSGHNVEVWSGRSDEVRSQSEAWLAQHCVRYTVLRMRRAGDYRQDAIVKAEWFESLPMERRPVLAFDDRQQVVDMWRRFGVRCCQVAKGDF
jgi:hypothetical protein